MTSLTKSKLAEIRKDIDSALAEVGKKHGISSFKLGTIRYDADGFKSTLEAQLSGGESFDLKTLRLNAKYIGFNDTIVNATIVYANKQCKVVGMKRTKLLLEVDGKGCSAPIESVVRHLSLQKSIHVRPSIGM